MRVEGLNLGLLVDAQHHGVLGRIDIQPDDVSDFVDQLRVRRQLEGLAAVGPQAESVPDATDGHATQPRRAGKRARAPMGGAGRGRLQRGDDYLFDLVIGDGARGPGSWLIQQPVDTVPCEAYVPHPVSWTHVYATRLGVACIPRGLQVACDTPAFRGASTGCSVRRTRRRPRAPRRGFERPGRRRLAP